MGFTTNELITSGSGNYLKSGGPIYGYVSSAPKYLKNILVWNTTSDSTIANVHIKTSWVFGGTGVMYKFIIEGYHYQGAKSIYSECWGYLYEPDPSAIYQGGTKNHANGVTISQYKSSDGYLTIKLAATTYYWYYCGFGVSLINPTSYPFSQGIPSLTVYHQTANL